MAIDKAIDSTEFDSKLTTVADAIRTAGGTTATMSFPTGMIDAISSLSSGGGITPSGNKAITATTSTQTGIDVTNYATVSVAPTPSETKSVTTNGDVTPSSGKLLSKVTVNVPTGTARDSSDLTVSGATVNVPAGLYSSAASKSVASGTAGTPTASKSAVSNNSVTVTPSVTNTEGYITGGTKTGTGVTVSASELVSGNKAITPSETAQSGIDVTNFQTASVGAISSTYVGSGVTRKAEATVAPSTSEQTVCASGVYTTGEQKVSAITPSIVGNLDASSFAASIVAAVEGKGVTVPDGTLLDGMASLIDSIEGGGGAAGAAGKMFYAEITPATSGEVLKLEVGEKGERIAAMIVSIKVGTNIAIGKNYGIWSIATINQSSIGSDSTLRISNLILYRSANSIYQDDASSIQRRSNTPSGKQTYSAYYIWNSTSEKPWVKFYVTNGSESKYGLLVGTTYDIRVITEG